MAMESAIPASLMRWMYDFIKVEPTCLPCCSGNTAREWTATVLPYSSCPISCPFSNDSRSVFQFDGSCMDLSVTRGADVRVAMTCAIKVGWGFGWPSLRTGIVKRPRLSSGHLVRRYRNWESVSHQGEVQKQKWLLSLLTYFLS